MQEELTVSKAATGLSVSQSILKGKVQQLNYLLSQHRHMFDIGLHPEKNLTTLKGTRTTWLSILLLDKSTYGLLVPVYYQNQRFRLHQPSNLEDFW